MLWLKGLVRWRGVTFGYLIYWFVLGVAMIAINCTVSPESPYSSTSLNTAEFQAWRQFIWVARHFIHRQKCTVRILSLSFTDRTGVRDGTRNSSVDEIGKLPIITIQKLGCGFLFAFYSNYGSLSCIISEIKRDINLVENRHFFHTALHSTPPLGGVLPSHFVLKLECWDYLMVNKRSK